MASDGGETRGVRPAECSATVRPSEGSNHTSGAGVCLPAAYSLPLSVQSRIKQNTAHRPRRTVRCRAYDRAPQSIKTSYQPATTRTICLFLVLRRDH